MRMGRSLRWLSEDPSCSGLGAPSIQAVLIAMRLLGHRTRPWRRHARHVPQRTPLGLTCPARVAQTGLVCHHASTRRGLCVATSAGLLMRHTSQTREVKHDNKPEERQDKG